MKLEELPTKSKNLSLMAKGATDNGHIKFGPLAPITRRCIIQYMESCSQSMKRVNLEERFWLVMMMKMLIRKSWRMRKEKRVKNKMKSYLEAVLLQLHQSRH